MAEPNPELDPTHHPYRKKWWWRILYALGIFIERQSKWRFGLRLRRRFFYLVGGGAVASLIILLGLAKYSESPSFCHSCHIMEPYYQAWKGSKHNSVSCVTCHYPPGSPKTILWKKFQALSQVAKYVTRTYSSKPFAEVEDAACLQCHSTRLLEGKLTTARGILFDHKAHLTTTRRDRKLACTSCHAQMTVGNHMEVTWNTCYLCHFKGMKEGRDFHPIGGCLACHTLPDRNFKLGSMVDNHRDFSGKRGVDCMSCHQDVVQGTGDAPKDRCFTCHNQPEKLERISDIPFIHENHITKHNVACYHCHTELEHRVSTPGEKELAYDCSVCHLNQHLGQKDFYRGTGAKNVPAMPSPMYLANVDCVGCHINKTEAGPHAAFGGQTFKAPEEAACVRCHGKAYAGMTASAKGMIAEDLRELKSKWEAAREGLAASALPKTKKGALQKTLKDAEYNLDFIESVHAVHNIYYAAQILREVDRMLTSIGEQSKIPLADVSDRPIMSGGFCAVMCHQGVGVKVPPETVRYKGRTMPHLMHAQMMSCTKCHEFGSHKDVRIKFKEQDCQACHAL
ncbi:MAG: hypothetical protein A2902_06930 [Elusimicrobia bacterium RIFCSPLOWO2_01_FULL_64_13]|nr:MAG: hypothetical protein A2902_06930 [Elusimicrobia bacterium RIFCSPLOWO2_01_FULL_64_13]